MNKIQYTKRLAIFGMVPIGKPCQMGSHGIRKYYVNQEIGIKMTSFHCVWPTTIVVAK